MQEEIKDVQELSKGRRFIKEAIPYVIIVVAAVLIRLIFLINATVPTGSMLDTIPLQSRILGTKFAYWGSEPERGDIIVFEAPDNNDTLYVKRVIGLPGDTVEIKNGITYVNGEALSEPYLREPQEGEYGPFEVPEEAVFVMGDNRNNSNDARFWNTKYVPYENIQGKAYLIYWPFSSFGWLY